MQVYQFQNFELLDPEVGDLQGGHELVVEGGLIREVADKPISVQDLFCTLYHALGINPRHENQSNVGRPLPLVEGGQIVREVFA